GWKQKEQEGQKSEKFSPFLLFLLFLFLIRPYTTAVRVKPDFGIRVSIRLCHAASASRGSAYFNSRWSSLPCFSFAGCSSRRRSAFQLALGWCSSPRYGLRPHSPC